MVPWALWSWYEFILFLWDSLVHSFIHSWLDNYFLNQRGENPAHGYRADVSSGLQPNKLESGLSLEVAGPDVKMIS